MDNLIDKYVEAAKIAEEIGFDAVDIKSCHGYLLCELLSAYNRDGKYGGCFENRTKMLLTIIDRVKAAVNIDITLRLNAFDEVPYPYGWGADKDDFRKPDLSETKELVKLLRDKGIKLINITAGNPYYNPHVNRPYDQGFYLPPSNQLENEFKMLNAVKELKSEVPELMYICSALTWFRNFSVNIGAGGIAENWFDLAGFGRQGFAYPDFPNDLKVNKKLDEKKCCITCGKCTELMRYGQVTGCVIRDTEIYSKLYREVSDAKNPMVSKRIAEHI